MAEKRKRGEGKKTGLAKVRGKGAKGGERAVRAVKPGGAIALTGVNTFLGRSLVALLERSPRWRRIVAIDLRNADTAGPKTRFYKVDLTQPAVDAQIAEVLHAEKVDTVVHGAFLGVPSHATAWAHELESAGTMHVVGACEEHRVRKLVLWSHTMLYGARAENPMYMGEDHPLRGHRTWSFIGDKLDAERQVADFAERLPATVVTVMRTAPVVGPIARNIVTDMLRWRTVPVVLGHDPLVQLVHELDVVAAFRLAIDEDHPGAFNVVAPGVLPLSSLIRLAGRLDVALPYALARGVLQVLFSSRVVRVSPDVLDYMRYPFVASGARAREVLGFRASYTTREALEDFVRHLRQKTHRSAIVATTLAADRRP
ncbi:MAG: NAD-dependent epimerase/dehydratase family protein [Acidobacteriota bacterium]